MSEKQTALKAAKALRDKARGYAHCGHYVPEDELREAFQAAIDEAEYVNRLVIASQEIDLKERRKQSDALVKALGLLLPIATSELDRMITINMVFQDNATGQEFKRVIALACKALEPFKDRPHKEMRK